MSEVTLYKKAGDKLQCILCPNNCILNDNQFGVCKTRKREKDKVVNPYYGILSSTAIDPIEKKPLYHFYPGSDIFSVGFFGCTLKCGFCQNYTISQYHPNTMDHKIKPSDIIYMLNEKNIKMIAFTYSEPTLYFNWVMDTAKLCKKSGIKTVLVTNGYLNKEPAATLLKYIDAANIDLKSSKNNFYKNICGGKIEPVKEFIKTAYELKVHIELTTLVVTDTNDTVSEMNEITDFIHSISKDIPFHISRYHPVYKFDKPPTDPSVLNELIKIAKQKLNFVYGGNILDSSDSKCKKCNEVLIRRNYYSINIKSINNEGNCQKCGTYNNIIF